MRNDVDPYNRVPVGALLYRVRYDRVPLTNKQRDRLLPGSQWTLASRVKVESSGPSSAGRESSHVSLPSSAGKEAGRTNATTSDDKVGLNLGSLFDRTWYSR